MKSDSNSSGKDSWKSSYDVPIPTLLASLNDRLEPIKNDPAELFNFIQEVDEISDKITDEEAKMELNHFANYPRMLFIKHTAKEDEEFTEEKLQDAQTSIVQLENFLQKLGKRIKLHPNGTARDQLDGLHGAAKQKLESSLNHDKKLPEPLTNATDDGVDNNDKGGKIAFTKSSLVGSKRNHEGQTSDESKPRAKRAATSQLVFVKDESSATNNKTETDPANWYEDTQPLVVLRYYAANDVTHAQIENTLKENSISTLEDLVQRFFRVASLIREDSSKDLIENLLIASRRIRKTIEEVLGGGLVYDKGCISAESLDMFTLGAVSVEATSNAKKPDTTLDRKTPFNLVLGSSGSGKTSFALKQLPKYLFEHAEKMVFTVHFKAAKANDLTDDISFSEAVAKVTEQLIAAELSNHGFLNDSMTRVNLFLHVVIDEAGDETFTDFFDKAIKIESIKETISSKMLYKFQYGLQVTVVGTGLDKVTAGIVSVNEANKYRMQPWTQKHFRALVRASNHSDKELILDIVQRFPIFQHLTSNGRCAVYVLRTMSPSEVISKYKLSHFLTYFVSKVADLYVRSNRLKSLDTAEDNWKLCRAVFKELDKATSQPGIPFFPEFDELKVKPAHRSAAIGLLDVNVESVGGHLQFVRNNINYSFSISPALVIVLAMLLNAEAGISWDWQGFESVAALSELKWMVARSQDVPKDLSRLIVKLPKPVPTSKTCFSVPVVDNFTVLINGPLGSYADVIAPYRLVQAKFSNDSSTTKTLKLQTELDKMGLTKTSACKIQRHLTRIFYTMWKNNTSTPGTVRSTRNSAQNECRLACYPMNSLNACQPFEEPVMVKGSLDESTDTLTFDEKHEMNLVQGFDVNHPVTAVFVTNCKAFKIEKTDVCIWPADLDWEGKLKVDVKLPRDVLASLEENVEVRFLFF